MHRTPDQLRANVADVLRTQGRRMTWLAAELNVNRTNLYLMLDGERPMIDGLPGRIARLLGVPESLLFAAPVLLQQNGSGTESNDPNEDEGTAA